MLSNAPQTLTLSQIVLQFGKGILCIYDPRSNTSAEVEIEIQEMRPGGLLSSQNDGMNLTHITIEVKMLL
uniref:Uncharacterized protein n=1 Tax=Oryza punctata TaxID=4537 RepID=A0A0E0LK60_ORYPU